MEMVPSPLNLQGKWEGPVKKIKTHMSCTRNEEEEVKKSVSKADVLGYFTSLINKRKKNSKEFSNVLKKKNALGSMLTILICSSNMQICVTLVCTGFKRYLSAH